MRDDRGVGREDAGEPSTREPDEQEHEAADAEANAYAGKHGFLRSFGLSRTDVLRDEGGHGLHEGARHEHREVDKLAGDAVAGGGLETETVDEGTECEEGELRQALLHRERDTDGQKLFTLRVETEVALLQPKRKLLFQQDDEGADDADRLREDGRDGRTGRVEVETSDEQ